MTRDQIIEILNRGEKQFEFILAEIPNLYPAAEDSGQLLIGDKNAHIDVDETPPDILWCMNQALRRYSIESVMFWEIQARERATLELN